MASFHFDSGQLPPSISTESQNQGVKLQETPPPGGDQAALAVIDPLPTLPSPLPIPLAARQVQPWGSSWSSGHPVGTGTFSRLRRWPTLMNVMPSCWPMRYSSLSTSSVRALVASSSTGDRTQQEDVGACGPSTSAAPPTHAHLWLGPDERLKTALPSRIPALGRPWAKGTEGEASFGKPLPAAGQNPSASYG